MVTQPRLDFDAIPNRGGALRGCVGQREGVSAREREETGPRTSQVAHPAAPPSPRPAVRATDPETSREAWHSVAEHIGAKQREVLSFLLANPVGLTGYDLSQMTGIAPHNVAPRVAELRHLGLVEDSGRRRPGPTGRPQIVWRAVRS